MNWEGEPEVASDVWDNIMRAIREYLQCPPELQMPDDTDEDMPAEGKAKQEADAMQHWEDLRQWLLPETHDESEGLLLQIICDTCTRLGAWANRRRHNKFVRENKHEALPAFATLASQCKQLAAMAENCGQELFPRNLLEDMLAQIACETVAGHPGVLHPPATRSFGGSLTARPRAFGSHLLGRQ